MKYDKYGKPIMEVAAQKPQTNTTATAPLKTNTIAPQQKVAAAQNIQPQAQQNTAAQTAQPEQTTDWAAEYDKVMSGAPASTGAAAPVTTQPTQNVSPAAQATLGEGAGGWQAELDKVMSQIMGQGKFEYNMNGDAMYQQYADIYQNQANLGMQNAMAQAAALTGGYGSSYGQMVGQQAYAQQMQGLNQIGLDLYDRAYAQDQAERERLNQQYAMLADREALGYNRDYQQGRDTVADEQWNKQFAEQQAQNAADNKYREDALAEDKRQYDSNMSYQQNRDAIYDSQWKAELDRALANDEISYQQWQAEMDRALANDAADNKYREDAFDYQKEQDAINNKYREDALAEDKRQYDESLNWQREEYDKLYGDEGYYTKQNAIDNQYREDALAEDKRQYDESLNWQREEYDKLYGDEGYYTKQNAIDNQYREDALAEDKRQYDESLKWQKDEYDKLYGEKGFYTEQNKADNAYRDATLKQNQDEFNSLYGYTDENGVYHEGYYDKEYDRMYGEEGYYTKQNEADNKYRDEVFGYQKAQDDQAQKNWEAQFKREGEWYKDAQEAAKTTTNYQGTSDAIGNDVEVPKVLAGVDNLTTVDTNLFDNNGKFMNAAVVGGTYDETADGVPEVGKGTMTYNIGGKEIKVQTGTSPYTKDVNPDVKNGVMANGYQPDNIGGDKLVESDWEYPVNGQWVPVYEKSDGTEWAYDAANNKYFRIPQDKKETDKKEPDKPVNTVPKNQGGMSNRHDYISIS